MKEVFIVYEVIRMNTTYTDVMGTEKITEFLNDKCQLFEFPQKIQRGAFDTDADALAFMQGLPANGLNSYVKQGEWVKS